MVELILQLVGRREVVRRGPGWRWRAAVGDGVCDGHVDLVAHSDNDGNRARHDRLGNGPLVEAPQILLGSASAHEEDYIRLALRACRRCSLKRGAHLPHGHLTLHAGVDVGDARSRCASGEGVPDIGLGGAPAACDHDDPPRDARRRALARRIEQAPRGELRVKRAHPRIEVARPYRRERLAANLGSALLGEVGDAPLHHHLGAVGWRGGSALVHPEHDGVQARLGILEREVPVAVDLSEVEHLASHADAVDAALERPQDARGDLGDGQDALLVRT